MASSWSKYSTVTLTTATALTLMATTAQADVFRVSERFERKRVNIDEEVSKTVDCPRGTTLTGGGYALYNLPSDRIDFMVTASYPFQDGWRVEIRNTSGKPQPLAMRLYALCLSTE